MTRTVLSSQFSAIGSQFSVLGSQRSDILSEAKGCFGGVGKKRVLRRKERSQDDNVEVAKNAPQEKTLLRMKVLGTEKPGIVN
jgi:hypothetical protein